MQRRLKGTDYTLHTTTQILWYTQLVKSSRNSNKPGGRQQQAVRIIGGRWRGTKLPVVRAAGLRPTSDRVRETLFNWLAGDLAGAHCIDLFAGTGALGFEALSRGASRIDAVEQDVSACRQLQDNKTRLEADNYRLHRGDAFQWFARCEQPIDILFLDPPFDLQAGTRLSSLVASSRCFGSGALIYLEQPRNDGPWPVPPHWYSYKSAVAGDVRFELYVFEGSGEAGKG